MKILRVISDLYPDVVGGMGIHGHEMSKDQSMMGHKVTVYTSKGTAKNNESRSGYWIERFTNIRILGNAISLSLMLKLFQKKNDFDVIHAHSHLFFSTFICAVIRRLGSSPLIVTNHGLMSQTVPNWINHLYNLTVARWIFKTADTILCYTEEEKNQIVDWGIQPDKITVIHNGVDTTKFTPPEKIKPHKPQGSPKSDNKVQTGVYPGLNRSSSRFSGYAEAYVFVGQRKTVKTGVSTGLDESIDSGGFVGSCDSSNFVESIDSSGFAESGGLIKSNFYDPVKFKGLNESSEFADFIESGELIQSNCYIESNSYSYVESNVYVAPSKTCELLWVGRFIPGKGVGDLLDTFAVIHEKSPDCKLLMVGGGPQLDEMKNKIRELNLEKSIEIKAFIPNSQMNQLYQKSSVFILTSLEEGVPRSILEAMASGLPVVCTALPQISGVVKNGGMIIPPKDTQKFADSVLKILGNPQLSEKMGKNGRKNVVNNFSWHETVTKTLEVYQSLINNSKID